MRGALARLLSAAASSSSQQVGMAKTPNFAKEPSEEVEMEVERGARLEGRKGVERMDVAAEDWAEEVANQEEEERATTPMPTPARWATPTSAPVTPTKGSKRMALGTPKPGRHYRSRAARPAPIGFAAQSALEQILGAVARLEKKMEEKVAGLEVRMMEGMGARAAEEEEREKRAAARLLADAEEREKRIASRLLALDAIETELAQKGQWEIKQWTDLAALLEKRRVEIREIAEMVAGLVRAAAIPPWALTPRVPSAPAAPQPMEGVVATPSQKPGQELAGGGENMEGVEREGLFASQHAPALGEPTLTAQGAPEGKGEEKKKKEKGKGKAVRTATPPAEGRVGRQQRRQAAVNAAMVANAAPAAAPRSILKRPEMVEAEREQAKEKVAEEKEEEAGRAAELERRRAAKAEAKRRWEGGNFEGEEGVAYGGAMRPILSLADESQDLEEMAAGKRIAHMVGMRAVEEHWEEEWDRMHAAPPPPRRQQQQGQQQRGPPRTPRAPQQPQRQQQQKQAPQLRQQQDSWAQRAAAAAARPQTTEEGFNRVGRGGKAEKKKTGLEPIKGYIPWDERTIAFERAVGAHQINQAVAAAAAAQVNIALSKVAPAHVRTEAFKISPQGRLTTAARAGASAATLLAFKKEILEAARRADRSIINVAANSTWVELKILVPYAQY